MDHRSMLAPDTQVALLLTTRLTGDREKPLSAAAYSRLAKWLHDHELRPSDLLKESGPVNQPDFRASGTDPVSVRALLDRGVKLALDLDRWAQKGIWVLGRGDDRYPAKLRRTLKSLAPPVLFGAGDPALLSADMIAVVGSRDAGDAALSFARDVAAAGVRAGYAVVSGAARGIDRAAMDEALSVGGRVVGVMAEGLEKVMSGRDVRDLVRSGRGCFVSMFEPDARWTVGRAMERNKIVYALSAATFVAQTDVKGGTWEGAQENLKRGWAPLYVYDHDPKNPGGRMLAQLGAAVVNGTAAFRDKDLRTFLQSTASEPVTWGRQEVGPGLFDAVDSKEQTSPDTAVETESSKAIDEAAEPATGPDQQSSAVESIPPSERLYASFLSILLEVTQAEPLSASEIGTLFDVPATLVKKFLDRATMEGAVMKAGKRGKFAPASKRLV